MATSPAAGKPKELRLSRVARIVDHLELLDADNTTSINLTAPFD